MRLTLRRLLAYLDDILDPSDQEAIRAKIDESEYATDLLHRTRDAMRRLRLGAPDVLGGDGGLDPNTVAEYLDHTLPQEQVEDFERFCLESDIHLAEAGSCHQILTMVLGEPADVEPESRQRMYAISAPEVQQDEPQADPPHVPVDAPPELDAPPITTTRVEVPDYLREPFGRRHRGILAAVAVVVIAIAGYFLWPSDVTPVPKEMADAGDLATLAPPEVDGGDDLIGTLPDSAADDVMSGDFAGTADSDAPPFVPGEPAESGAPPVASTEQGASTASDTGTDTDNSGSDLVPPPPLEEPPVGPSDPATGTPDSTPDSTPADLPREADPTGESLPGEPMPADPSGTTEESTTGHPATGLPEETGLPGTGLPDTGLPDTGLPTQGTDTASPAEQPGPDVPPDDSDGAATAPDSVDEGTMPTPPNTNNDSPGDGAAPSATEPGVTKRIAVATYSKDEDLLLRYDSEQEGWVLLPDNAELFDGDVLVAVPACRPRISLVSGIEVRLDGGSRMVVLGNNHSAEGDRAESIMGIELVYGRAILRSFQPGPAISLRIGDEHATVRFPGAAAELAVEAFRTLPTGSDPLNTPANVTADYYATSGRLQYQNELSDFDVAPHSWWHLTPDGVTEPAPPEDGDVPKWFVGTMPSRIEKVYSIPGLSAELVEGEPIELYLSQLIDHRREEIRWIAGRTSVHVGQFDAPVRALDDPDQRTARPNYIRSLKTALAAGPEAADGIRTAFRRRAGEDGDQLFKMLCGYSEDEIDTVRLKELIDRLEHKKFLFRVLAIHNLKEITNEGDLGYRPEYGVERRRKSVNKWKERLDSGELLQATEP